jgi:DTW domain-containing protein
MSRNLCSQCHRPISVCYCHCISTINNALPVIIIQHPLEAKHPYNTGKMAELTLSNCQIIKAETLSVPQINSITSVNSALLYPNMAWLPATEQIANEQVEQLVVIDANWRKSKKILYLNPSLQGLPRIALEQNVSSNYQIRQSSIAGSLATVESIYYALQTLEPKLDLAPLLAPFNWMVEQHKNLM